jgi:hypothetical protein
MTTQSQKRFATVREMPHIYPSFTEASIRWLIFNEKTNGFSQCLRRIGRRKILIDLDRFEKWIDQQQEGVAQ